LARKPATKHEIAVRAMRSEEDDGDAGASDAGFFRADDDAGNFCAATAAGNFRAASAIAPLSAAAVSVIVHRLSRPNKPGSATDAYCAPKKSSSVSAARCRMPAPVMRHSRQALHKTSAFSAMA